MDGIADITPGADLPTILTEEITTVYQKIRKSLVMVHNGRRGAGAGAGA